MTAKAKKYLFDIGEACDSIAEFIATTPTLAAYLADKKTRRSVERELTIIGEAVNGLRREPDAPTLTDQREIVRFRNHLVHGYDSIQHETVWVVIRHHLPVLRAEVARWLAAEA